MRQFITQALVVTAVLGGLTASIPLAAHDPIGSRVTWTGDIARIFQARCVGCHRVGSADTMALTSYEEVRPWVSAIRQQVLSRKMPIWHAARGFGAFANDPSLSPFEIALIAAWANVGGPQGNPNGPDSVPRVTSAGGTAHGGRSYRSRGRPAVRNPGADGTAAGGQSATRKWWVRHDRDRGDRRPTSDHRVDSRLRRALSDHVLASHSSCLGAGESSRH